MIKIFSIYIKFNINKAQNTKSKSPKNILICACNIRGIGISGYFSFEYLKPNYTSYFNNQIIGYFSHEFVHANNRFHKF